MMEGQINTELLTLSDLNFETDDRKFYKDILAAGPPEGMHWHPSYIKYLQEMAYNPFVYICYDGPIYQGSSDFITDVKFDL